MNDDISRDLGRIEGKLDSFMGILRDHTDRMNRMDDNHEQLVDKVEANTKKTYLIMSVGSAIWAVLTSLAMKYLHG